MDSGLIDSSADLGLNTPADERVQFRRVTTCAVVAIDKYASGWTEARPVNGQVLELSKRYSWMYYDLFEDPNFAVVAGVSNESTFWLKPSYYMG